MCIKSRWDWAREGWEDKNDWGYQIAMDTEPSNDSCWKANWWQGRMNACIWLLHACWLLKFASRSVFRKSLQGKGKGWYSLGCDDQEEAHWTSPIWQVPNWQVPSCTPKEWLQEDFSQENCSPEDHWSACLCSKAEGFQSSWIALHCCTQAELQLTSATISFLTDMCLTLSATAFLNSWNEIKWLCIVLWRGKIKNHFFKRLRVSGLVMKL